MEKKKLADLRPFPAAVSVKINDKFEHLVKKNIQNPESHNLCVVNEEGILLGVINVKKIFRTIFSHHTDPETMVRHLISLTDSEVAGDIMVTEPVSAMETDTLGDVIRKMIENDLGELPVVDEGGRLLGTIHVHFIFQEWLETRG